MEAGDHQGGMSTTQGQRGTQTLFQSAFSWQNATLETGDLGRGSSAEEHVEMESTKKLATSSLLPSIPRTAPSLRHSPVPGCKATGAALAFLVLSPFHQSHQPASSRALLAHTQPFPMAGTGSGASSAFPGLALIGALGSSSRQALGQHSQGDPPC